MLSYTTFVLLNGVTITSTATEHTLANGIIFIDSARTIGEYEIPKTIAVPLTSIAMMY